MDPVWIARGRTASCRNRPRGSVNRQVGHLFRGRRRSVRVCSVTHLLVEMMQNTSKVSHIDRGSVEQNVFTNVSITTYAIYMSNSRDVDV